MANGAVGVNFMDDFHFPQGRSAGRVVTGALCPVGDLCGLPEFQRMDAQSVTKQGIKNIHISGTLFTERLNQRGECTEERDMVLPCYVPLYFMESVPMWD